MDRANKRQGIAHDASIQLFPVIDGIYACSSSQKSILNFINKVENTGQTLAICKKQFGQTYHVSIFAGKKTDEADSKRISPEFATTSKAQAYAIDLMEKHPNGIT